MDGIDMSVLNGAEFKIRKGPRAEQVPPVPIERGGSCSSSGMLSSEQDGRSSSGASSLQVVEDSSPNKLIQEAGVVYINQDIFKKAKLPWENTAETDYDAVDLDDLTEVVVKPVLSGSPQFSSPGAGSPTFSPPGVAAQCVGAYDYKDGEEEEDGVVAPPLFVEGKLHVPKPEVLFGMVKKRSNSLAGSRRRPFCDDKWKQSREMGWAAPKKIRPEEDAVWEKEIDTLAEQLEVSEEEKLINVGAVVRRLYPSKFATERKRRELLELHQHHVEAPKPRTRSAGATRKPVGGSNILPDSSDRFARPLNKDVPSYPGHDRTSNYTFKPQLTPHDYTTTPHLNVQLGNVWERLTKEKPAASEEPKPQQRRKTSKPPVARRKRDVVR